MNQLIALIVFLAPAMSLAYNDLFSSGQCSHPQQNYPIEAQDERHANEVSARELERSRSQAERLMPQLNADLQRLRKSLDYYFHQQWADAMITHMDNGLDCCDSSHAVSSQAITRDRRPAGSDVIDNSYEVVDPSPIYEVPTPSQTDMNDEADAPEERYSSGSGLCLQTGFAASKEWNQRACRNGGRIDPEVCGDSTMSRYPRDYKQCVDVLEEYYRLSYQKRRLSSEIQAYNSDIGHLRRGRSEVKSGGGFLAQFLKTVAPLAVIALLANQSQKSVRHQYQDSSRRYSRPTRSSFGRPNSLSGRYSGGRRPPPPPYYGEDYGYPMQNEGMLGQILPALMSGAFGCSQGSNGAGFDLGSLLGGVIQNPSSRSRMPPYAVGGLNGRFESFDRRPYSESRVRSPRNSDDYAPRGRSSLGQNRRDAFFYSKLRESEARRERIWANDVYSSQGPTSNFMNGLLVPPSSSFSQPSYAAGTEFNTLLQSLLGGRARVDFSLDAYSGY